MTFLISQFSASPFIELPQGLLGWSGWLLLLAIDLLLLRKWNHYNKPWGQRHKLLFLLLLVCVPFASLFFGIRLPPDASLATTGHLFNSNRPAAMVFAQLPWMIAAGFLGPASAAVVGLAAGIFLSLFSSHNIFSPLVIALLAILYSAAVCQRYRSVSYNLLRHPAIAASALALFFPLVHLFASLFTTRGSLFERMDIVLTGLKGEAIAMGASLLVAGLICEMIAAVWPEPWGKSDALIASPMEKSLQARLVYYMAPLSLLLVVSLMLGNWIVAGKAAQNMIKSRMESSAKAASDYVSHYLGAGLNLISIIAQDPRLLSDDSGEVMQALVNGSQVMEFFHYLGVHDASGRTIAFWGESNTLGLKHLRADQMLLQSLLIAESPTMTAAPPEGKMETAQVTFIAPVLDENNVATRILIGESDLASNPLALPIYSSLQNLSDLVGQGYLIDENGHILIHPDRTKLMTVYDGPIAPDSGYFDSTATSENHQMVFFQRVEGFPWAVVITVPVHRTQNLAFEIAAPLLVMIVIISLIALLSLVLGLRFVTGSLQNLARVAGRISEGRINYPLSTEGTDEIGQLRRSFEQMRSSLRDRLDDLNRLLVVSQGVASSLEFPAAIQPVLEASLSMGASSARIVMQPSALPEIQGDLPDPIVYGVGPAKDRYQELDEQLLYFIGQQEQLERLVLPDINRPRLFNFSENSIKPASLLAVALRHENMFFGVLWTGFEEKREFSEEEVRFLVTLGGQAALAAANTRQYQQSEIRRQQLEAILASTPDPVLVTDHHNRLLLANPQALQLLGLSAEADYGKPIEEVISDKELIKLLLTESDEAQSHEIKLQDKHIYMAIASTVKGKGHLLNKVCVLHDITAYKELDALKSEFVRTVSHEVRSPLTLMRGYATMLEMVGELNEQQKGYVKKIITGVESLSRLVNNLLDLGRLEAGIALKLENVSGKEVLEHVVSALNLHAVQKKIELKIEGPVDALPSIEADQALLQQAIQNLVENAIKFTRPDGKVAVGVTTHRNNMRFRVSDNGIGISPVDQQNLFEKFHRIAHQGDEERRGTGLGLAIVKSIADRHHGRVWIESQLGKGSSFYLEIPLKQPDKRE